MPFRETYLSRNICFLKGECKRIKMTAPNARTQNSNTYTVLPMHYLCFTLILSCIDDIPGQTKVPDLTGEAGIHKNITSGQVTMQELQGT